jgi:hypothetical protein
MPRPKRSEVYDASKIGVYHCRQRVVRRGFLCGFDPVSRRSFNHRRDWIEERLAFLCCIFAFDVFAKAILSNHYHIVVRNRPDILRGWSDREVALRWWKLFPQRLNPDGSPAEPTPEELALLMVPEKIVEYRRRLGCISWFMRSLSEPIARAANREDECTGHFWEGRFRCTNLLDPAAILACCVYVDLNPIRARMAETPELSLFTSIFDRIMAEQEAGGAVPAEKLATLSPRAQQRAAGRAKAGIRSDAYLSPIWLDERASSYTGPMPSQNGCRASDKGFLPITQEQYFELLDWTGRQLRSDGKAGTIPANCAPILERIGLSPEAWCELIGRYGKIFKLFAGTKATLQQEARQRGRHWYQTSQLPAEMAQSPSEPAGSLAV